VLLWAESSTCWENPEQHVISVYPEQCIWFCDECVVPIGSFSTNHCHAKVHDSLLQPCNEAAE
jgi:hypothetical protein